MAQLVALLTRFYALFGLPFNLVTVIVTVGILLAVVVVITYLVQRSMHEEERPRKDSDGEWV